MPLPDQNITWPPVEWAEVMAAYRESGAWYSGNVAELAAVYGGSITTTERPPWWRFWSRRARQRVEHTTRTQLHIPLAADMAAASAALLFGEAAKISLPDAHVTNASSDARRSEDRLQAILDQGDVEQRLTEAAEIAAAFGGVFLKPAWDVAVADVPLISVVHPDMALPEFRLGRLMAVTLWRVVEVDGNVVYRHLERHETDETGKGIILHGLYVGSEDNLGSRVELGYHPDTADLQDMIRLPFDGIGIRYIPNRRPNRRFRGSALGQSDYHGAEGMMDALDETWTSWMRDIRLGKARLIVPDTALELSGERGLVFDMDQEIFTALSIDPMRDQSITASQFSIRVDEHERTSNALIERIVSHAGYSPQTFGLSIEGRAETGTALRVRERKTLMTQQHKRRSWESALADIVEAMLHIDRDVFRSDVTPSRPTVTMADSLTPDELEIAQSVELVARAGAASTETLVRRLNPEWDDEQVVTEVQRIRDERGLSLPDPIQVGIA